MKSATVEVKGDYAYGWLRTETGVHRLVRKSPFDSATGGIPRLPRCLSRRKSMMTLKLTINPADLKTDVYRSSGAGGQHVNKTESLSASRTCPAASWSRVRTSGSQHKNRSTAMKDVEGKSCMSSKSTSANAAAKVLEDAKSDVSWGNQIRSYVLDQSRIKDLRTGVEVGNTTAVLDGDLDQFLEASLKAGVQST